MAPRLARTNAEAHLFMELTPCSVCQATDFTPQSSVIMLETGLGSRYTGLCGECGAQREFTFRIPDVPVSPAGPHTYGGAEPSELIDPGTWLWIADQVTEGPADPEGLSDAERAEQRELLAIAVACLGEVLKFVPADADAVPADAFFTAEGRAVHAKEPGRFSVVRLHAVREVYAGIRERFEA